MDKSILSGALKKEVVSGDFFKGKVKPPDKRRAKARFNELFDKRMSWERRWKEIRDYQLPYLGCFDDGSDNPGRRRDEKVVNGVAWESAGVFASGVMSGLTPPSRQWFRFCFADRELLGDSEACKVIEERQEIVMGVLARSNFYNAVHSVYMELPFGQCPLAVFPHAKTGVHFMPFSIGSYAFDVGAGGDVNVFAHRYKMTAVQLKEQFGEGNLPRRVLEVLKGDRGYSSSFDVCWLVDVNDDAGKESKTRFDMPYRSLYWVEGSDDNEWLYAGGFYEWAVPTARYLVTGNEAYGKGPGWFAEGDSKMLQVLEMDYLKALELSVKPPMQAQSDTVLKGINLIPGGATVVDDLNKPILPLFQVNVNFEHLRLKVLDVESRIKRHYSADLFLMLDSLKGSNMTAREVMERTQEKLQQLGPMVERLQFEFLTPVIERVYGILERANVFPAFSDDVFERVNGREIRVEYVSPLAQAQKMSGLVSIEQAVGFIGQLSGVWPEAKDKLDPVATVSRYAELLGAPASIMRSDDEVYALVEEQKAKEAQERSAMQMASAVPVANEATKAARNLSEATGEKLDLKGLLGLG